MNFFLLLLIIIPILSWAGTTQTITPLPGLDASFAPNTRTFLANEDAARFRLSFEGFVASGGLGPTSPTLTHITEPLEAVVHGYFVKQDALAILYTANRRTYVYADSLDSRSPEVVASGGNGCTFKDRVGAPETRLVRIECNASSSAPVLSVPNLILLFFADTSSSAITTITDARFRGLLQQRTGELYIKDFGAKCDGVTDDTAAIQAALKLSTVSYPSVRLCSGFMNISGTLNIDRPVAMRGSGMRTSRLRSTSATLPMITINAGVVDVTLEHFQLDRTVNALAGANGIEVKGTQASANNNITINNVSIIDQFHGLLIGPCAYCRAYSMMIEFNNGSGLVAEHSPGAGSGVQWQINEALIENNKGIGVYSVNLVASSAIGPFLSDVHVFNNHEGGVLLSGGPGTSLNDVFIERLILSTNNQFGIHINTWGSGHTFSEIWVELSGQENFAAGSLHNQQTTVQNLESPGIAVGTNLNGVVLNGGVSWTNSGTGIEIAEGSPYSVVSNFQIHSNGLGLSPFPYKRTGLYINADNVLVNGNSFGAPAGQTSHIYVGPAPLLVNVGFNTYNTALAQNDWFYINDATNLTFGGVLPIAPAFMRGLFVHARPLSELQTYDVDNTIIICSDCQNTTTGWVACSSGGTGALAWRRLGTWICQ